MTSFELPDDYLRLREQALEVAAAVADRAATADDADHADPVMLAALAASGLPMHCVPAAYGGVSDRVDTLAVTVVREALMATSAHLDGLFGMQGVGSYALSLGAEPTVRETWLPRVARLESIAALALTEPDVGSDLKAITTTIVQDGGHLRLDGHKSFITNAGDAAFYTVLGREGEGYSLVFVPADTPGVEVRQGPRLLAPHIIGDVVFQDVKLPAEYRVGAPGEAFRLVLATLATFRVSVAGAAVGLAQAALDEALRHTTERHQFGAPLATLGPIPHLLGTSWMEIEQARTLTYRAAARAAADPLGNLDLSSMAKVAATETAGRVTDRAVQMFGRFGVVAGSTIERLYRNARPMRIYEGGNEVLLGQLARRLVKQAAVVP